MANEAAKRKVNRASQTPQASAVPGYAQDYAPQEGSFLDPTGVWGRRPAKIRTPRTHPDQGLDKREIPAAW